MSTLVDNARRWLAQTFLSWALGAHAEEVIDTVLIGIERSPPRALSPETP